ncbi:MAG TPA: tRNA (adenosine(37)-N6)-threonylcarbamoyltransferase complex transferase subunit TsaD [Pyrinomonadaceae bacterium]|nr:tRNA (adenosine(37)-N6)-threonylcarbamoyltransferase complex transferase subunit TsaD [Pyrinomonadaceae bacterium]
MLVLGIETSCDETAAAVVLDGSKILSSEIYSQIDAHRPFGGVVPEIASREHLVRIDTIVDEALRKANVVVEKIDAVAVTQGPGLIGSLLVGVSYAKTLAFGLGVPCIGVNHIEGHVYSVVFENPPIEFPALALIVSGGHTNIFFIPEEGKYRVVSRTRDDAAGEAFDKVAKLLGLGYPGGPAIEKIAVGGNADAVKFPIAKISDGRPDISFSGLKTAVQRYIQENPIVLCPPGENPSSQVKDIAASFQETAVRTLIRPLEKIALKFRPRTLIVAGGVACNFVLRKAAKDAAARLQVPVYFPSRHLSTDNAAMIAAAGHSKLKSGTTSGLDLAADVTMRLQNIGNEDVELRRRGVHYRL